MQSDTCNVFRFVMAALLTVTLVCCSTVPQPIEQNVKYPYAFRDVAYLEKYGRIGFDHIADLTVDLTKLVFSDKDLALEIKFESIDDISYEKMFFTDPNNFVVISYQDGSVKKKAMFTAFRYAGWLGGTAEIHQVILHAYSQYKTKGI